MPIHEAVIYADGPFLLCDKEETCPAIEFHSNVALLKEISVKLETFLVVVIEEGKGVAIVDLKVKVHTHTRIMLTLIVEFQTSRSIY